ncbi:MerR family transcriptional regulator [Nocardia sp. NPDC006630]|uniref:MerR family transcriptional regulator n=1 Tax=Nocardia sp. NPDC006630 TaxID=3157181 RepID=UPI0033A27726
MQDMKIGDAAAALGIEAHVLRHWESVGLLQPSRSPSGHRSYDENILDVARLILKLQRTGLSLGQIRQLGVGAHDERLTLIAEKRAEIQEQIVLLRATDRFLQHLADCRHGVVAECAECSDFSRANRRRRPLR